MLSGQEYIARRLLYWRFSCNLATVVTFSLSLRDIMMMVAYRLLRYLNGYMFHGYGRALKKEKEEKEVVYVFCGFGKGI
jgi:hypothetical protein